MGKPKPPKRQPGMSKAQHREEMKAREKDAARSDSLPRVSRGMASAHGAAAQGKSAADIARAAGEGASRTTQAAIQDILNDQRKDFGK